MTTNQNDKRAAPATGEQRFSTEDFDNAAILYEDWGYPHTETAAMLRQAATERARPNEETQELKRLQSVQEAWSAVISELVRIDPKFLDGVTTGRESVLQWIRMHAPSPARPADEPAPGVPVDIGDAPTEALQALADLIVEHGKIVGHDNWACLRAGGAYSVFAATSQAPSAEGEGGT